MKVLRLAGLNLKFFTKNGINQGLSFDKNYKRFISHKKLPSDINFCISREDDPRAQIKDYEQVFCAKGFWRLYYKKDGFKILKINDIKRHPPKLKATALWKASSKDVFIRFTKNAKKAGIRPFFYPLDELFMADYLCYRERGIIVHACGISGGNKGYLFIGPSGSGKSTIAKLFRNKKTFHLLNDDRIIIRKVSHKYYVFGTPWHGEVTDVSRKGIPLEALFFIEKSPFNYIRRIKGLKSFVRLFRCSFLPYWDKKAVSNSVSFYKKFLKAVDTFSLGVFPDKNFLGWFAKNI